MRTLPCGIILFLCFLLFWNCGDKANVAQETTFTKQDSLTERYLGLQDSLLKAWNMMIHDDNEKLTTMHNLLHELMVSNPLQREELHSFEERLNQLAASRYTQKTMENTDVIEEYDFASNSLVVELIAFAESQTEFSYNTTLQKLTDEIRMADQRVNNYREEYDAVVVAYNTFIEKNKGYLKEIDQSNSFEKKPLFQMVSE